MKSFISLFLSVIPKPFKIFLPIVLIVLPKAVYSIYNIYTVSTIKLWASFFEPETSLLFNSFVNEFSNNESKRAERRRFICTTYDSWVYDNFILTDWSFNIVDQLIMIYVVN